VFDVTKAGRFLVTGPAAQAAAGQEGINLTSSFIDGVAFFQITDKGLIVIADVAGTRFWVADTLN
jgi:predicted aconitase